MSAEIHLEKKRTMLGNGNFFRVESDEKQGIIAYDYLHFCRISKEENFVSSSSEVLGRN